MKLTIDAVAFDKDGVIFDSESVYETAFLALLQEHQLDVDEDLTKKIRGLSIHENERLLAAHFGDKMDAKHFVKLWIKRVKDMMDEEGGLHFIDGVESLIETLYEQGFPLALVTSDSMDNLLHNVNRTRVDLLKYFSVIVTLDDVQNPKPNPEPYERAASLLGVEPKRLLVIEDSEYGVMAASSAGANVLMLAPDRKIASEILQKVTAKIDYHRQVLDFIE